MEITPASSAPRTTKVRSVKSTVPELGEPANKPAARKPANAVPVEAKPKTAVAPRKRKAAPVPEMAAALDLTPMIATAAYYLAEQRQFAPGYEMADWLAAEHFIRSSMAGK